MSVQSSFTYDVYLSFRGEDTRFGFTSNLFAALKQRSIHTFTDDALLLKEENISQSLFRAIEESRIFIIIFSPNYASSKWCLEELTTILEYYEEGKKKNWGKVLPIFYDVDPSDVRNGRGSYGEALDKHEEMFKDDLEKVDKWRFALRNAANFSGFHFQFDFFHPLTYLILE